MAGHRGGLQERDYSLNPPLPSYLHTPLLTIPSQPHFKSLMIYLTKTGNYYE